MGARMDRTLTAAVRAVEGRPGPRAARASAHGRQGRQRTGGTDTVMVISTGSSPVLA
ncbi:hypothetical protein GCM10010358_61850 [Streptomyces minutiscleroticus]|uniref:Uncharacterized protein n=1 Tax=Streptomyces minutiscleroticus TaxID=68238 RepID=A0A918U6J3_9ACTN|nr:hypothetical protein GCM10010358_61850 [Streptomyces minutiscleroticus]